MVDALSLFKIGGTAAFRGGTIVMQKISRLRRIDDAIKGVEESDQAKAAIEDFEIVKGSWIGEFTVTIDKFMRQLERSPLIHTMMSEAVLDRQSNAIRRSFLEMFRTETGQSEENGVALYGQITKSFAITAKHLMKDPIVADFIRVSTAHILQNLQRVEAVVHEICEAMKGRPAEEILGDFVPKLVRAAVNEFRIIRVETSQGRKDVDINKIYIAPRLSFRESDQVVRSTKLITDSIERNQTGISDFRSIDRTRKSIEQLSNVDIDDVMAAARVVVLGDPGGGKSTLLQSVCHSTATKSLKFIQDGGDVAAAPVPIRVILREFEKARVATPQLSIFEYICLSIPSSVFVDRAELPKAVNYLLGTGKITLAFDGLDEILRTAQRRTFVDLVVQFTNQYPLCPVIVTSRLVGYDKAPLPDIGFEELVLGDFKDNDVELYATKFVKNVGRKKVADARAAASRFMHQTSDNAADIRRNPLMLGLMMWIFNIRDDVPSSRPEVYRECAELMFERWDADRDIMVDLPQTFDRLQVFCHLASQIFEDEERAGGVSSTWIEASVKAYLVDVLESRPDAHAAAQALVKFIVDRSWVMSEKGDGVFSFTHQTFLEYFFAKNIDDQNDTVRQLFETILPHIKEEEWDVVSRLALQIKTYRNRRKEDEAIGLMEVAIRSTDLTHEQMGATTLFGARCLEFLIGSEAKIRALVTSILDACLGAVRQGREVKTGPISFLLFGAKERREFVSVVIGEYLKNCYETGSTAEREFVVSCIDSKGTHYNFRDGMNVAVGGVPRQEALAVRVSLKRTLRAEALADERSAKLLFEWFGIVVTGAIAKHGIDFLNYARPETDYPLDGITALAIAASGKFKDVLGVMPLRPAAAELTLRQIGEYIIKNDRKVISGARYQAHLNGPPASFWAGIIKAIAPEGRVRLGALPAFYASIIENNGMDRNDESLTKSIDKVQAAFSTYRINDPNVYTAAMGVIDICREAAEKIKQEEIIIRPAFGADEQLELGIQLASR